MAPIANHSSGILPLAALLYPPVRTTRFEAPKRSEPAVAPVAPEAVTLFHDAGAFFGSYRLHVDFSDLIVGEGVEILTSMAFTRGGPLRLVRADPWQQTAGPLEAYVSAPVSHLFGLRFALRWVGPVASKSRVAHANLPWFVTREDLR